MCTVVIEVPEVSGHATRVLAVRDELPERAWDPPGEWWPEHPRVVGVRDRLAGGAWLAARGGALSVILNRGESVAALLPAEAKPLDSRGGIVLQSVEGLELAEQPHTESFNLIEVRGSTTRVHAWNGHEIVTGDLEPGIHMIAHGGIDDLSLARISAWLPEFRLKAGRPDSVWRDAWLDVIGLSTRFEPGDDRALIRDNTAHGYPTKSLLMCLADVREQETQLSSVTFAEPAQWNGEEVVESLRA